MAVGPWQLVVKRPPVPTARRVAFAGTANGQRPLDVPVPAVPPPLPAVLPQVTVVPPQLVAVPPKLTPFVPHACPVTFTPLPAELVAVRAKLAAIAADIAMVTPDLPAIVPHFPPAGVLAQWLLGDSGSGCQAAHQSESTKYETEPHGLILR